MPNEDNFIPGIYNYCDRWCERCKYTDRCYSYQMEVEAGLTEEEKDSSNPKYWEYVSNNMAKALEMIRQHAEEMGIDLDNLPEVEEEQPSEKVVELEEQWKALHDGYLDKADAFFENSKEYFPEKGQESIRWVEMGIKGEEETLAKWQDVADKRDIIGWYMYFIWAKIARALNGYDEIWGNPLESDSYRTSRILVIAIERSMAAWQVFLEAFPEKEDEILDMLALLEKLRRQVVTVFPDWHKTLSEVVW